MTRGMKGCYVYFTDNETAKYFRGRLVYSGEQQTTSASAVAQKSDSLVSTGAVLPFERIPQRAVKQYVNSVPLIDLKFAAGVFGSTQAITDSETAWVKLPDFFRPQPGLFVAQVIGESMNHRIPNGAWCLFRMNPVGTRQGKVVVAQHRSIHDPDLGGSYTVKVYQSEKSVAADGGWRHARITLKPDSTDASYTDLEFDTETSEGLSVVAELISVL